MTVHWKEHESLFSSLAWRYWRSKWTIYPEEWMNDYGPNITSRFSHILSTVQCFSNVRVPIPHSTSDPLFPTTWNFPRASNLNQNSRPSQHTIRQNFQRSLFSRGFRVPNGHNNMGWAIEQLDLPCSLRGSALLDCISQALRSAVSCRLNSTHR